MAQNGKSRGGVGNLFLKIPYLFNFPPKYPYLYIFTQISRFPITINRASVQLQTELDVATSYCQLIIKMTISKQNLLKNIAIVYGENSPFWRKSQFRSLYTVFMVIETKVVTGWFKLQLWKWLAYWTVR